eukprot:TRINITY_DN349_c0_g2_i1.p2 TRINITY_DN349_c0_g2~~TRINITY_DN349_c0_g2_i1.p2  ORF type:complete len:130 (-),score=0.58 TRINITY_DN349_c0_g2_i1:21-410(-)
MLKNSRMTCGQGQKINQTWRQLVLPEIALGLASRVFPRGQSDCSGWGGAQPTPPRQTPNTVGIILAVSLRGISFVDERERAQIGSQGPQYMLSVDKEVVLLRQLGCWLRSSHHLKSAQQLTSRATLRRK